MPNRKRSSSSLRWATSTTSRACSPSTRLISSVIVDPFFLVWRRLRPDLPGTWACDSSEPRRSEAKTGYLRGQLTLDDIDLPTGRRASPPRFGSRLRPQYSCPADKPAHRVLRSEERRVGKEC